MYPVSKFSLCAVGGKLILSLIVLFIFLRNTNGRTKFQNYTSWIPCIYWIGGARKRGVDEMEGNDDELNEGEVDLTHSAQVSPSDQLRLYSVHTIIVTASID